MQYLFKSIDHFSNQTVASKDKNIGRNIADCALISFFRFLQYNPGYFTETSVATSLRHR